MNDRVRLDSLVTLHYRLATGDDVELVSTFGATPATLQLGSGELAPPLEACLEDLPIGDRFVFLLEPEQAFGPHNPALVRRLPLSEMPTGASIEPLSLVEFATPDGAKYVGLVREVTDTDVLMDFNHPLAGKPVRFEVEIVGIL